MNRARRARRILSIAGYFLAAYLIWAAIMGIRPDLAITRFPTIWTRVLLPMMMQLVFASMFIVVQFVVLFWYMSKGRTYNIYPNEYDVTFNDVRGQQAALEATKEVLRLFLGFKEFREMGGYPPHGILFEGPPGTGKTLMAKAVAGEAKVPFIYASGTSFSNMFMGIGNLRIARLFTKARKFSDKYAGCVIFLDELDAVGGSRGGVQAAKQVAPYLGAEQGPGVNLVDRIVAGMGGMGMGSMLVNELLVQMDGLLIPKGFLWRHVRRHLLKRKPKVQSYNILIIGATNRADTLDPALLRPGRFDRKIHVGLPDAEGRKDIIQYYLDKVRHEPIDLDRFARATAGYSPARLKNIINESLILALQEGRTALNWNDVWQAKLTDEIGLKQPVRYSPKERMLTAVHEAGHAVSGYFLRREIISVEVVSIVKREHTLGLVHGQLEEERFAFTRDELMANIKVSLSSLVAEELWCGTVTEGTTGDLIHATVTAARMLGRHGMVNGLVSWEVVRSYMEPDPVSAMIRDDDTREKISAILEQARREVEQLLRDKARYVEAMRDALLEKEELYGDEIKALMERLEAEELHGKAAGMGVIAGGSQPPLATPNGEEPAQ